MSQSGTFKELETEAALARLCVVSFIQSVGVLLTFFLIKFGPYLFGLQEEASWQRDCLQIAYVLFGTVGVLFFTFSFSYFWRWRASIAEFIIWLTFVANILAFCLAMARTGGPADSFFGQLIPMQLSGMLLLEQQKAMLTRKRTAPWVASLFTVLAWIVVVVFDGQVANFIGWENLIVEPRFEDYENFAASILFILELS